jgi:3'(2'), 5'-bisphosphate nucleotidase
MRKGWKEGQRTMQYERELEAALESASRAGRRIMELYEPFVAIPDARADISTEADRDSQELILQTLRRSFPADAFCAEEQTPTLAACARSGDRLWVIDPIDGTRGFAQKNGQFSVMIALLHHGEIAVGVVLEPATARLTYAVRAGGCWRRDGGADVAVACRVSSQSELAKATLVESHSRSGGGSRQAAAIQPARLEQTHSAGVKLARVARGEAELYVNHYPNFHDWDICAGHVLVEEAGGRVTGLKGQPIRYSGPMAAQRVGLLASNGKVHDAALKRLRDL